MIDKIRRILAYMFFGCPICYSLNTVKVYRFERHCLNCQNRYDVRIWQVKDED